MDTNIRRRKRATTFRRAGWLAVTAMVLSAVAGPGVAPVLAASDPGCNALLGVESGGVCNVSVASTPACGGHPE